MADNHRTRSVQESLAHMNAFEMKRTAASPSAIPRSGGTAASPSTQGREAAAPPRHSTPAAPPLMPSHSSRLLNFSGASGICV